MVRSLVVVGLLFGVSPALAQGALPDGFFGDWQGTTLTTNEGSRELEVTADDLSVRIEPEGNGFQMRWTALAHEGTEGPLTRRSVEARFVPTERAGVFAFDPEESSMLLRLFGDPSINNPLEGEPLLWARLEDRSLSVYGLVINHEGGFDLYQHVRTLTDDGMTARHTHRTEHEPAVILEGQLQRAGG